MRRPKFDLDETTRRALEMAEFLPSVRALIESRLAAGMIDGFLSDIPILLGKQSEADGARVEKLSSTLNQNEKAIFGANLVSAVRNAVKTHNPGKSALLKNYGVGEPVRSNSVSSVCSALAKVLKAAREDPETARSSGLLPDDLTNLENALASLSGANASQEGKKRNAKTAIAARNAAHLRVEDAMAKIQSVARIVFIDNPEMLAQFASCMPGTRKSSKKAKKADAPTT